MFKDVRDDSYYAIKMSFLIAFQVIVGPLMKSETQIGELARDIDLVDKMCCSLGHLDDVYSSRIPYTKLIIIIS